MRKREPKPKTDPSEKYSPDRVRQKHDWNQWFNDMRLFGERQAHADGRVFLALFGPFKDDENSTTAEKI